MSKIVFNKLINIAESVHKNHPLVNDFCEFPDDIQLQDLSPNHIIPSTLLQKETDLFTKKYQIFRDAFIEASPFAHWRETYKDTDIGKDFMERFGCYCLIGPNAPFFSLKMHAFVVYMPPHLFYPWHNHPGEEMYLTIAGEAEFMKVGEDNKILRAGGVSEHKSNQPHAMRTHNCPVMAYVIWRSNFETGPVWTGHLNS